MMNKSKMTTVFLIGIAAILFLYAIFWMFLQYYTAKYPPEGKDGKSANAHFTKLHETNTENREP